MTRASSIQSDLTTTSEARSSNDDSASTKRSSASSSDDLCPRISASHPTCVVGSILAKSRAVTHTHTKSHDVAFSRSFFADPDFLEPVEHAVVASKRATLPASISMSISRSHQEMIDGSPRAFERTEAEGLFDSVRGLMHDLHSHIGAEQPMGSKSSSFNKTVESTEDIAVAKPYSDHAELRSWLASPDRTRFEGAQRQDEAVQKTADAVPPSITVAVAESPITLSSSPVESNPTKEVKLDVLEPTPSSTKSSNEVGQSPRIRMRGDLLRAPSPAASASSYASDSSFVNRTATPLPSLNNHSISSLVSKSSFSLFSRESTTDTQPSPSLSLAQDSHDIPLRLSRRKVDEDRLAALMISCADARHVLKTDTDPAKLKQVGLKLELGWREQLAESQTLAERLEFTQDTVEDLEDENKHLRSQLGSLSEQIVSREEDLRLLSDELGVKLEKQMHAVSALERENEGLHERIRALEQEYFKLLQERHFESRSSTV